MRQQQNPGDQDPGAADRLGEGPGQKALRRLLDMLIAVTALVVTSPLIALCAVAVRLSSPGPVLHRAVRIGMEGRPFTLLKFRTMVIGASSQGPGITAGGDSRITGVGGVLRRTKLDELPQFWNVLRGEMSVVGPRPEDPRYVEGYTADQRRVLAAKPGITGPASVQYRDEESILAASDDLDATYSQVMAEKLKIDIAYIESRTLRSDIGIVAATIRAIFSH